MGRIPQFLFITVDARMETAGLSEVLGFELSVPRCEEQLTNTTQQILTDLVALHGTELASDGNRRFSVGFSLVALKRIDTRVAEVCEYDFQEDAEVPGLNVAATIRMYQEEVCERFHAAYDPPAPDSLTALSPGLKDAQEVEGARYSDLGATRSGWVITAHPFTGGVEDLVLEHTIHLAAWRPDLVSLLALPAPFRFIKPEPQTFGATHERA